MPLNNILKRASSFLGFIGEDQAQLNYEDGDIVYCKNNVCVHTPSQYRGEGLSIHHPGYMVVKCHCVTSDYKSLTLSWIPNERLKRNHDLIYYKNKSEENSPRNLSHSESDSQSISSIIVSDFGKVTEEKLDENVSSLTLSEKCQEEEGDSSDSSCRSAKLCEVVESDSGVATKSSSSLTVTTISDGSNQCSPDGEQFLERAKASEEASSSSGVCVSESTSSGINGASEAGTNGVSESTDDEVGTNGVSESTDDSPCNDKAPDRFPSGEDESPSTDEGSPEEQTPPSSDAPPLGSSSVELSPAKNRYISSSSDSSSENGKHVELTLGGIETSESSFQVETNNSEDEISLDSSTTDLQASPPPRYFSSKAREQWYDRSAESMAISANLAFPESPSALSSLCPTPVEGARPPSGGSTNAAFSASIWMKSLRLFFSDKEKTCGQLVIASQESQYKILHFHCGGLDKLASVFEDWNFLISPLKRRGAAEVESPTEEALKQFSVCRPEIKDTELHPEEGSVECLDPDSWVTYFSADGVIEDDLKLRRAIFFGGIEPRLRTNVWPFLLHFYDFRTTFLERQAIMEEKHQLYHRIDKARRQMTGEEKERFWKAIQCTVEKDVVRTDRSKPCFAGKDNPNIEKMKNILLNFAYYNPEMGYTQGMSDILSPILAEVRNEADVFWCFSGMMSKTIFVTSPRDRDMERNLRYLGELLRLMVPAFYDYVRRQEDGLDLLFCHRWILLCFKREFAEDEALAMWVACWSHYQTDYFHLFLVVAIIAVYGTEVAQQQMRPDEMLLFFTSLANHMDGGLVLKKARGLLHQFRSQARIPCTLVGLCELCGPGMWDSGHAPTVVCAGHPLEPVPCLVAQSAATTASYPADEGEYAAPM